MYKIVNSEWHRSQLAETTCHRHLRSGLCQEVSHRHLWQLTWDLLDLFQSLDPQIHRFHQWHLDHLLRLFRKIVLKLPMDPRMVPMDLHLVVCIFHPSSDFMFFWYNTPRLELCVVPWFGPTPEDSHLIGSCRVASWRVCKARGPISWTISSINTVTRIFFYTFSDACPTSKLLTSWSVWQDVAALVSNFINCCACKP